MKLSRVVLLLGVALLLGSAAGAAGGGGAGRIVFASDLPRYPPPANLNVSHIYSIGTDGRGRRDVGGAPGADPSLSPDGTNIAFLRHGLWVMNADGSAQRLVLSPGPQESFYGGELAWSPDGTKLAVNVEFTSPCPGPVAANKCWEPTVSGVIVDLAGNRVGTTGLDPSWSPDGKRIVSAVDESGSPDERDWQIVVSNVDGTSSRELTQGIRVPEDACWANPSWSPDGRRIAASLLACGNAWEDIWLRSYIFPVGKGPRRVLDGAGPPVWSPDGTKLAFLHQYVNSEGYVDRSALYVARSDGSRARLLRAADPAGAPVWSPKGGRLTYASARTGQIETIGADGTRRRGVTRELAGSFLSPFAWSRDGRRILYEAAVVPTHANLWTMSPTGTGVKRLTRSRSDERDAVWSTDGRLVAFSRWSAPNVHVDETGSIFTIRSDGAHERLLIGGQKGHFSVSKPSWSPDGKRIAFVRSSFYDDYSGPLGLFVANADGTHARRLVEEIDSEQFGPAPDWSPDGKHIAYGNGGAIRLIKPDGTGRKRLTPDVAGYECSDPAWSRDGQRLALVCGERDTNARGVFVMNADGTDLLRLLDDRRATSPTWSPDGATIAFSGVSCLPGGHGDDGICAVAADGSGLRALTPFRAVSTSPTWSTSSAGLR